ncbi:hypothetical protein BASA83_012340 [Batrachochytrium salamandrivorans]|nr:hypothetical protein BASA83_012340 [Batrachochytrium salamandrivorans]
MKLSAFSLIAMFMVTANALVIPMDSTDDASGLVKRQSPNPTEDPTLNLPMTLVLNRAFFPLLPMSLNPRPTDEPTPNITPRSTPTNKLKLRPTDEPTPNETPVLKFTPTPPAGLPLNSKPTDEPTPNETPKPTPKPKPKPRSRFGPGVKPRPKRKPRSTPTPTPIFNAIL